MKQAVYVGATNLHNVAGRIEYISSEEKQENLYATYETAPREFWQELRTVNQEEFRRFGTNGKCIEARELIISLPKGFTRYDSEDMLKYFTDAFKEKYGVECISALHHNKRKTNLHIHLIFAERKKLLEPEVKVATRAMYFDNKGNRIRTKKEAMNDKGKLKRGYKMVPKGAVYEENTFTPKIKHFKDKGFLDEVKQFYVDIMNEKLDDRNKMMVFPKGTPLLPNKKIGKNNPKAKEMEINNWLRDSWNDELTKMLYYDPPMERLMELKKELITDPVRESIGKTAEKNNPIAFRDILVKGVKTVKQMLYQLRKQPRIDLPKIWKDYFREFIDFCKEHSNDIALRREERDRGQER